MTLWLGGSLKIRALPEEAQGAVDGAVQSGERVLIGDAPGADALFQRYLRQFPTAKVEIFHSSPSVRFNLGNWPVHFVQPAVKSASAALHGAKDREIAIQCDSGLMVWDGKSVGTVANVLDLSSRGKEWRLFVATDSDAIEIPSLDSLVNSYGEAVIEASKRLEADRKRKARELEAATQTSLPIGFEPS